MCRVKLWVVVLSMLSVFLSGLSVELGHARAYSGTAEPSCHAEQDHTKKGNLAAHDDRCAKRCASSVILVVLLEKNVVGVREPLPLGTASASVGVTHPPLDPPPRLS